jgi:hypothetical protein
LVLVGAAGILTSGYVHYYLYFEGGYRGIQPESVFGLTISRAFILNAIAAVVIAEGLVVSLLRPRLAVPAALAGVALAATSLVAYALTRTTGFLGFSDSQAATEAVIAVTAEIVAVVALAGVVVVDRSRPARDQARAPSAANGW